MVKIATLLLVLVVCARGDHTEPDKNEGSRQKRLLFFDEGGSLVKTYSNPYLNNLALNADKLPYYGNILNPFFNFIQAFGNSLAAFTIPVSNEIVQQIKKDPIFQSSLVVIPRSPVVEPNPHCEGKRTQIPSPAFCNNFLNCWDGWAVEQECPTGLLFSNSGYCDYADNVDCHNRKVNADKLQPQPQPVCSKDFEAFRSKLDCSEFFVCVNRQPVRFKCPADLAYSQVLGVCDYVDQVDCKSSSAPSSIPMNPPYKPSFPSSITNLPFPSSVGPIIIPQTPSLPDSSLPQSPSIPASPLPPSSSPEIPSLPQSPSLPSESSPISPPSVFPSLPNNPPFESPTPTIPPKFPQPSYVPPGASISPGSPDIPSSPMVPPMNSDLRPTFVRPIPPAFQDSVPGDKPGSGIFTPGCASNVAMSRQDAIRQLQGQNN